MGNHEEVLLRILSGETSLLADWLRFGGAECARSYGIDPKQLETLGKASGPEASPSGDPEGASKFLAIRRYAVLRRLPVRPRGDPPRDPACRIIAAGFALDPVPFLEDKTDHGCVVVHGHTITAAVDERTNASAWTPGRIGRAFSPLWAWRPTSDGSCRRVRRSFTARGHREK